MKDGHNTIREVVKLSSSSLQKSFSFIHKEDMESTVGLGEMRGWSREVCALMDARGTWRTLAARVDLNALVAWFDAQPSPTLTLLNHLKVFNKRSSLLLSQLTAIARYKAIYSRTSGRTLTFEKK